MRVLFAIAGVYHLSLGVVAAAAPKRFFEDFASYGPYNDHFIRDVATFYLAIGAVMIVAAARKSWRVPVLTLVVVQYFLHVVNHAVDVGDTEKGWQGPVSLVALAAIGVGLWWLLRRESSPPG